MTINRDAQVGVLTQTGSVYRVARDPEESWWFTADNQPNRNSRRLDPGTWWRIQTPRPWPPELGEQLWLMPPEELDQNDPQRVPGGGKHTSLVRAIRRTGDEDR